MVMINAETEILLPGQDFDAIAVINIPKGRMNIPEAHDFYPDPRLANEWGRDRFISFVAAEGVEPFVTRGATYYDLEEREVRLLRPHVDIQGIPPHVEPIGRYSVSDVGVIHNNAGALPIEGVATQLNEPSVRALAVDKHQTASLLKKAGLHEGSVAILKDTAFNPDVLDEIMGTTVFVKPRFGSRSEGVLGKMTKSEVATALQEADQTDYVVEGVMDYSHRWPGTIKAVDEENQAILDRANLEAANKELRAYSFGKGEFYYVGRVAREGETDFAADDWVFLVQDSIPSTVRAVANEVYLQFVEATGVSELHLGIDMPYASTPSSGGEPSWRVGEVNAGEPQLAKYSENVQAADDLRKHLAVQIARIARKRSLA